jgi:hypothetical protein
MGANSRDVTGYTVYEGKSALDGSDIVGIVTLHSENSKTGDMAQLWILSKWTDPVTAVSYGLDRGTCGDCPFRAGHGCYVTVVNAPLGIWRAYHAGRYPVASPADVAGLIGSERGIRLGAYGDPMALPLAVCEALAGGAGFATGYTHSWRLANGKTARWARLIMASTESAEGTRAALARGWRVFAVTDGKRESIVPGLKQCPATSKSAPSPVHCIDCGQCNGAARGAGFWIGAHGSRVARALTVVAG